MYLARELTDHSLPAIGRGVGGRNHATVIHAIEPRGRRHADRPRHAQAVDNLRTQLGRTGVTAALTATIHSPQPVPSTGANPGSQGEYAAFSTSPQPQSLQVLLGRN